MAVRCSKDLAGHWLLPCPWSLILASGPELISHLNQVANVSMPRQWLSPSSEYRIPMSGISPSRKSSLDRLELDQSLLLLFLHPKAVCYQEKQVGFTARRSHGLIRMVLSSCIIWVFSSDHLGRGVLLSDHWFCNLLAVRNLWVPHCKGRAILGIISTISY